MVWTVLIGFSSLRNRQLLMPERAEFGPGPILCTKKVASRVWGGHRGMNYTKPSIHGRIGSSWILASQIREG
jgi:hypothetical protein